MGTSPVASPNAGAQPLDDDAPTKDIALLATVPTDESVANRRKPWFSLPTALPLLVIALSAITWVVALSRSGFWADDFLLITTYSRSLGTLTDVATNGAKYTGNLFWAVATTAFGDGSAIPFLVLNTLIFVAGVTLWLRFGLAARWSRTAAWWVAGGFIASATWLPIALWSANVVHSAGFLALGLGLFAHQRCVTSETHRHAASWCAVSTLAWTLAVVSNILFTGLLVMGAYCAWAQFLKLRAFGRSRVGDVILSAANVLVPVLWIATVAYPATTALTPYSHPGIQFVVANLAYYQLSLAPTWPLVAIYLGVTAVAFLLALVALRRRDPFPMAVLCAAGLIAASVLIQQQQRAIHYAAMPILLILSAVATGIHSALPARMHARWMRAPAGVVGVAALIMIFQQGADVRSFFVDTPYGSDLAVFRSQVAALTAPNSVICAQLKMTSDEHNLLTAEMSGARGFTIPPIDAEGVDFTSVNGHCPGSGPSSEIVFSVNDRGEFVASRPLP
jgi:hypothetical protein